MQIPLSLLSPQNVHLHNKIYLIKERENTKFLWNEWQIMILWFWEKHKREAQERPFNKKIAQSYVLTMTYFTLFEGDTYQIACTL